MGKFPPCSPILKQFWSLLITSSFCLFLSSCNSEMANLSPIKNAPFELRTANLGAYTNLFIYMTKSDGKEAFGQHYTAGSPTIQKDVPQGDYHFYGIAYNGNSVSQCAIVSSKSIRSASNLVVLEFDSATCGEEIFIGPSVTLNRGTPANPAFAFTSVEFCEDLRSITGLSDSCTDDGEDNFKKSARGHIYSFRWSLQGFKKTRGNLTLNGEKWWSTCTDSVGTDLRGLSPMQILPTLPAGDGSLTPFFIRLELWPGGTGCGTGDPIYVDLQKGLLSSTSKTKYIPDTNTHKLFIKVTGEDICRGSNLTLPFAGGSGAIGAPKLICTAEQFLNILPDSTIVTDYENATKAYYKLLAHIDLTNAPTKGVDLTKAWAACVEDGSNFMPIGIAYNGSDCSSYYGYTGKIFDGGEKTITGLKIKSTLHGTGLFRYLDGSTVQRVKFQSPEIQGIDYVATVAAYARESIFRSLTVKNALITGTNHVGGIIGYSEGGEVRGASLRDLILTGNDYVGGAAGLMSAVASPGPGPSIRKVYIDGSITGNSNIGGIAGSFGSINTETSAGLVRFKGDITASGSNIGGLFGRAISAKLIYTYAQTSFISGQTASEINLGGLIGNYSANRGGGDSGVESSYVLGSLSYACAAMNSTCQVGTVIGYQDGSYSDSVDFYSVVFSNADSLSTGPVMGAMQLESTFMSSDPQWKRLGIDIMGSFPSTVWKFSDTDYPSFITE